MEYLRQVADRPECRLRLHAQAKLALLPHTVVHFISCSFLNRNLFHAQENFDDGIFAVSFC